MPPGKRVSAMPLCQVTSSRYGSSGSNATKPPSAASSICQVGPPVARKAPLSWNPHATTDGSRGCCVRSYICVAEMPWLRLRQAGTPAGSGNVAEASVLPVPIG